MIATTKKASRIDTALAALNRPEATICAAITVPLLFGLYSLYLGADANWDLYNYHLYGPFAFLNDKFETDIGVAGFQGYFNPFLDFLPYWLNSYLPPKLSGFLQGWLHGLGFVLVLGIARRVLVNRRPDDSVRLPILLALAGSLTANFLSEVGNGMGDNTTAVLILSGIYLVVLRWNVFDRFDNKTLGVLCFSGVLVGLATGLKLTNGPSAVAFCLALLVCFPGSKVRKFVAAFLFGVGVLAGFTVFGGTWMLHMWTKFGNPLFPQFGSIFPNPLAQPMTVADTRWLPKSVMEYLLWPFIISLDSRRVGELHVRQIIWAIVYALLILLAFKSLRFRTEQPQTAARDARSSFIVVFVSCAFVVWMCIFSIYRYTVAFEMLAPLAAFIMLTWLFPYLRARRIGAWVLTIATAIVVTGGARTWGHEGWASPLRHTDLTLHTKPDATTVLLVVQNNSLGWLPTFFPPQAAFFGIETGFPGTDAFVTHVRETAKNRNGPIFIFTNAEDNRRALSMQSYTDIAHRLGLTSTQAGCDFLRFVVARMHFRAVVDAVENGDQLCRVAVRPEDVVDVDRSNQKFVAFAAQRAAAHGFQLIPDSCKTFTAGIGTGKKAFQYCSAQLQQD
ncbi:hypothetical protein [Rhizobium mesoamericanum]|uniref:Transmembrane protein n=1 Tax=Rhizobium mesoamericanum STM3625 TaxID=1211777 RepID=K0Q4N5_9HYPH|nr:hypothetical protein [Rhizobium mesoamericanum]CCM79552.1 conserved membrane hypothetical protein [Rhizobium mesoamericanum STM3625]